MTEPADLASQVLIQVATFVRKLRPDQLADLASGEAKLDLIPKGGRPAAPARRAAAPAALPRPAQDIVTTMVEIGTRAGARQYLDKDLKLTVAALKQLASDLGITVTGTKPKVLDGIVEWAVGRRLDSDAITRAVGDGRPTV